MYVYGCAAFYLLYIIDFIITPLFFENDQIILSFKEGKKIIRDKD